METESPAKAETLIPTATASPRPSATSLPAPTLPREEALDVVATLLTSNDGCMLPCWWGFVPGETRWELAERFLHTVAVEIVDYPPNEGIEYYSVKIAVPEDIYPMPIFHEYDVHDGIIHSIEVNPGRSLILRLEEVLKTYGEPEEIWVSTTNASKMGIVSFFIYVFYPQQGILIQYEARRASIYRGRVTGCPQEDRYPNLFLWSSLEMLSFEDAINLTGTFVNGTTRVTLEDATGLDVASYYAMFDNDNLICIETPMELWPPPE